MSAIVGSPRCVSSRARNSPALLAPAAAIIAAYLILLSGFKGTSRRLLDIEHTYYNLSQTNQKGSTMAARITGKVIVPAHIEVWPHEFKTAQALAAAGSTIEFLRRSEGAGVKPADIIMNGVAWEMKAPRTANLKKIQRVLRRASSQSRNVIIDCIRLDGLSDDAVERELRKLKPLVKSVKRIILVTKTRTVIDI